MSSLSASAENVSTLGYGAGQDSNSHHGSDGGSSMCLELALEGERLCKAGDCRAGVAFFQAAIQAGTDDLRTLSAIYSQLGNAYFYLGDYSKAMQYHKHDLTLAISMNDKLGEAKSSGNLGNTLKVMGRFDEAAICCERHLMLARQLDDKLSEGRALYNLGNVYHAKGKHLGQRTPGDFGDNVKEALNKAVDYYKENLKLMQELGDRGAQGRACGNLGNTYYLLGDFQSAIDHHEERLRIAREFGDRSAERRANSNLGNSHIFLGQFEEAVTHYTRTLALAIELGEREVEAQSCYSLGNTYTLLRDFKTAIRYHNHHLRIAKQLGDRVGEARACWSLGNAHSSMGNHEKALQFAELHLTLARELHDPIGESTARVNISDLRKLLGMPEDLNPASVRIDRSFTTERSTNGHQSDSSDSSQGRMVRVRRQSMEQLDLIKITPDGKRLQEAKNKGPRKTTKNEDEFLELLSRSQSKRMDDQRCSIKVNKNGASTAAEASTSNAVRKPLVQQNSLSADTAASLPGLKSAPTANAGMQHAPLTRSSTTVLQPDDAFLDMLMRCQSSRLEEQRSELPKPNIIMDVEAPTQIIILEEGAVEPTDARGTTVPDEDFFSLIMKVQSGRMEDQRASIPFNNHRNANGNAGGSGGSGSSGSTGGSGGNGGSGAEGSSGGNTNK